MESTNFAQGRIQFVELIESSFIPATFRFESFLHLSPYAFDVFLREQRYFEERLSNKDRAGINKNVEPMKKWIGRLRSVNACKIYAEESNGGNLDWFIIRYSPKKMLHDEGLSFNS